MANELVRCLLEFLAEYGIDFSEKTLATVHSVQFANSLCVIRKDRPTRNLLGSRMIGGAEAAVEPEVVLHATKVLEPPDQAGNPWSVAEEPPEEELPRRLIELAELETHLRRLEQDAQANDAALAERNAEVRRLHESLRSTSADLTARNQLLGEQQSRLAAVSGELATARHELSLRTEQLRQNREQLVGVLTSRSWRLTRPVRSVVATAHRITNSRHIALAVLGAARTRGPLAAMHLLSDRRLLLESGSFDRAFYLSQNPDVAASRTEPVVHYLLHGGPEGRRANGIFDPEWYRRAYPDVDESGMDPLVHYVRFGAAEGRDPSPTFSTIGYLAANPDVASAGANPLDHYIRFGRLEGRNLHGTPAPADQLPFSTRKRPWERAIRLFRSVPPRGFLSPRLLRQLWKHEPHESNVLDASYANWISINDQLSEADRTLINTDIATFSRRPRFSVLMPVYNPEREHLEHAIDSVVAQIYPEWELCISDDASTRQDVRAVLEHYARLDQRIHVTFRQSNGGISACTNSALALASGDWVVLLDHDDALAEHALYLVAESVTKHPDAAIVYSDEDKIDGQGRRFDPYFKPDFDDELFLGQNVVSHLGAYRADLARQVGGFREDMDGSQDWDFALRMYSAAGESAVVHVPFVLYHWRQASATFSVRQLSRARTSAENAVRDHLSRVGQTASVQGEGRSTYLRVTRHLPLPRPLVSVVIPTRDHADLLRVCVDGVLHETDYTPLEVVIVDNGSRAPDAITLINRLRRAPNVVVVTDSEPFNFSRLVNRGVAAASGEICMLLNNDIEVIHGDWLMQMVRQAVRPDVGAVGALLLYADTTIQHAGVVVGLGGVAGHAYRGWSGNSSGYFGQLMLPHSLTAVTAACMAVRHEVYDAIGGFDEQNLAIAFNDVDFCLRLRAAGYRVIWTPRAKLYHHESASRGYETTPAKAARFAAEVEYMRTTWHGVLDNDPFYNPNLSLAESYVLGRETRAVKPWLQIDRRTANEAPQSSVSPHLTTGSSQ